MILDFQGDPENAKRICAAFTILDLETDKPLAVPVWYADEDTGACRAYANKMPKGDQEAQPIADAGRVPSVRFTRAIAFMPRPGREAEATALRKRMAVESLKG